MLSREELLKVKGKVIAVDFDQTLAKTTAVLNEDWSAFVSFVIDEPIMPIIELCRVLQENNKMILWTVRKENYLEEAIEFTKKHGLRWDAVNENLYPINKGCVKVWANYYIDDSVINTADLLV